MSTLDFNEKWQNFELSESFKLNMFDSFGIDAKDFDVQSQNDPTIHNLRNSINILLEGHEGTIVECSCGEALCFHKKDYYKCSNNNCNVTPNVTPDEYLTFEAPNTEDVTERVYCHARISYPFFNIVVRYVCLSKNDEIEGRKLANMTMFKIVINVTNSTVRFYQPPIKSCEEALSKSQGELDNENIYTIPVRTFTMWMNEMRDVKQYTPERFIETTFTS